MNSTTPQSLGKKVFTTYWVLLLLGVLFVGPLVAAWRYYETGERWIPGTINWGDLIAPPVSLYKLTLTKPDGQLLTEQQLHGKWLMLYIEPQKCDKTCQDTLYKMRQVRLALGENMERVQRIIATFGHQGDNLAQLIQKRYRGTQHIFIQKEQFEELNLPKSIQTLTRGGIYIVDPLGNIMMHYAITQGPKGIYDDMRRLLKVSHIG